MKKLKKQPSKTPRDYLSWSQLSLWERSPELYRRVYLEGIKQPENQYLKMGKAVAERLETGIETDDELIEHLALFMPKYPKTEFEIKVDWEGVPLLGRLDGWNLHNRIIGEMKTSKNDWTQTMVDKSDQLTFYSLLIWLKYGKLPLEIRLHWAKTEIDENGKLQINGDITTFKTIRTLSDIILLRGRIKVCWEGIQKMCKNYARRDSSNTSDNRINK